jgi:hypothetical protein
MSCTCIIQSEAAQNLVTRGCSFAQAATAPQKSAKSGYDFQSPVALSDSVGPLT